MRTTFTGCLAVLAASLQLAHGSPPITPLDAARQAYYGGRYGEALQRFEQLAIERQDAEAAERAAFMLLHGPTLYGPQVRRDLPRASALLLQAARAGRPAAQFMLDMTEQTD